MVQVDTSKWVTLQYKPPELVLDRHQSVRESSELHSTAPCFAGFLFRFFSFLGTSSTSSSSTGVSSSDFSSGAIGANSPRHLATKHIRWHIRCHDSSSNDVWQVRTPKHVRHTTGWIFFFLTCSCAALFGAQAVGLPRRRCDETAGGRRNGDVSHDTTATKSSLLEIVQFSILSAPFIPSNGSSF